MKRLIVCCLMTVAWLLGGTRLPAMPGDDPPPGLPTYGPDKAGAQPPIIRVPIGDPLGKEKPADSRGSTATDSAAAKVRQLQAELEALRKTRNEIQADKDDWAEGDPSSERTRLKTRMFELLDKLRDRASSAPATPAAPRTSELGERSPPVDQVRQILNLYRAGDAPAALRAIQLIEPNTLTAKQSIMLRYIKASCYRRADDFDQAKKLYKEVADSKEDPFLAECAAWQLEAIQTREGIASQLDTTRKRSATK